MPQKNRDYRREYDQYQGTPEQIKRRAARNKARAIMEKKGLVRKGDGKDVDHKDFNPLNESPKNLRVISEHANAIRQPKKK